MASFQSHRAPFAPLTSQARRSISKTRHMWWQQCALRAWFGEHDPLPQTPAPIGSTVGLGIEVGILARSLRPDGVLIDCDYRDYQRVLDLTKELMAAQDVPAIFEAGFAHSRCLIRADILERRDGGWCLGEVKSSTKVKDEHLIEIALQVHVLEQCGVDLVDVELILIDPDYVLGDNDLDVHGLFKRIPVFDAVRPFLKDVPARIAANLDVLALSEAPAIRPSRHCHRPYECDYWSRCTANKPDDWVYPYLTRSPDTFARLDAAGIESAQEIPSRELQRLTPNQRFRIMAAQTGELWRSPELASVMAGLKPPISALDFETFNPPIPLYPGTSPYQRLPFQWSMYSDKGGRFAHSEFLAWQHLGDPRRAFTETLLERAEQVEGPMLVYSSFERSVLDEMATLFPDLADRLSALMIRLVDLLPVIRNHVIHPAFQGSNSLKVVAPALAPHVVYDDLDIAAGGDASAAFYRLVTDKSLTLDDRNSIRRSLLDYCQRDTMALLAVYEWLIRQDRQ